MSDEILDKNNLKALVSLLSDDDREVLSHVQEKILALGETMIPYLEQEWESTFNPNVQKRIVDLIHTVQFESLKRKLENWKNDPNQDLLEGMQIVATFLYPDLELSKLKQEFEQIYYEAWLDFKPDIDPYDQVRTINNVIFNRLKFSANTKNFHSASNSMMNVVLETKKGNPITLCVVYMLVAQKLGLPIYGVNLPNLFILTYKQDDVQFYINAFNKGLIFTKSDIDNYISHLNLTPNDIYFQPCENIDIVTRVLRNLIVAFEKISETDKVKEIKELLQIVDNHAA